MFLMFTHRTMNSFHWEGAQEMWRCCNLWWGLSSEWLLWGQIWILNPKAWQLNSFKEQLTRLKYSTLTHQKIILATELLPVSASEDLYFITRYGLSCHLSDFSQFREKHEAKIGTWLWFTELYFSVDNTDAIGSLWNCFDMYELRRTVYSISWPHSSYCLIGINVGTWQRNILSQRVRGWLILQKLLLRTHFT